MSTLYSIDSASEGNGFEKLPATAAAALPPGYTALVPLQVGGKPVLFAYNKSTQTTDVYAISAEAPYLTRSNASPELKGEAWTNLTSFTLGAESYLMAYERVSGTFAFFKVSNGFYRPTDEIVVSEPYTFGFIRNTPTQGFTTVAAYSSLGQIYFTGYDFDTGLVANFKLTVTSVPAPHSPLPLLALNVWYHHWAKKWTHFAFFQLGGSNFFFKINTGKLNVNIDHMQDDPTNGSVEVGSYLQDRLPEALDISQVCPIPWDNGEPYIGTYVESTGSLKLYRIHADCQGWTQAAAATAEKNATLLASWRVGSQSFLLTY